MTALLKKLLAKLEDQAGEGGAAGAGAPPAEGGTNAAGTEGAAAEDSKEGGAEGAAAGGAAGAEGGKEGAAEGAEGLKPEDYKLNIAEGVLVDEEIATEFKTACAELKLTQEDADRFAKVGSRIVEKQQAAAVAQIAEWKSASENDPEFGGENLEANRAVAEAGVDAIASPELKDLLVVTGMSNHPEVFRAFYKLGKMLQDDKLVLPGSQNAPKETTRAQRMFGRTHQS